MAIDVKKYVSPESEDTPIVIYQKDEGVIVPLDVVPSTENQEIETPEFVDGFAPVRVAKVTSGIDSNIQAGNIRQGVNILGVEGDVVPLDADVLNVTPSVSSQRITPTSPKNAFSEVNVDAVTAEIDSGIVPSNIKEGVSILGVNGSVVELKGEERDVTLNWYQGNTYTPSSGKNGITSITVRPNNYTNNGNVYEVSATTTQFYVSIPNGYSGIGMLSVQPVTSSIDSNIQAGNIKSGVSILGVTGSVIELEGETRTEYLSDKNGNTFTPQSGKNGITSITVYPVNYANYILDGVPVYKIEPSTTTYSIPIPSGSTGFIDLYCVGVTSSIDSNIREGNIKEGVTILGVTGTYHPKMLGLDVNEWGGTITNGVYSRGQRANLDFSGIVEITNCGFYYAFFGNKSSTGGSLPRDIVFPDLEVLGEDALTYAFANCDIDSVSLPKVTTISSYEPLYYMCYNATSSMKSFSMPNLTTISGSYGMANCCRSCNYLETIDLSKLEVVSGNYGMYYSFAYAYYSTNLNVTFPKLRVVSGNNGMAHCFYYSDGVKSLSMPNLEEVSGTSAMYRLCYDCDSITTMVFEKLSVLTGASALQQAFYSCDALISLSFPALKSDSFGTNTNQFNNMLQSSTGVTVHFPSNLQSVIGGWADVVAGFGGTNTTVLFDLTATE